jgi:streptogramin lyase
LLLGCAQPCDDPDDDGYGPGCVLGPDCDPHNAARTNNCATVPAPDCNADPSATGCPCLASGVTNCSAHPAAIAGAGPCRSGHAICISGDWGLCTGEIGPMDETCNGIDDDCDGRIDEGVRSPCGGCDATCVGGVWGESDAPFMPTDRLAVTDIGALTLAHTSYASATIWAANSADGTISRIDAASAVEVARYTTALGQPHGDEPSRIAVDWNEDAWVLNRAFDGQGSATKIASDRSRCIDRNGNGMIETSTGPTDIPADDECILFTVPVGTSMETPRAIAIDGGGVDGTGPGNPWVGLFGGEAILELDGMTGTTLRRVSTPSFAPYAAAMDPGGIIWMSSRDGYLARVDPVPTTPNVQLIEVPLPCWLVYSIAIDTNGRIGITGFSCDSVALYDPRNGAISNVPTQPSTRGAVFDPFGALWVAHTGGLVSQLDVSPLRVRRTIDLRAGGASPDETVGIASDTIGHVWAVSEHGGASGFGVASRVDLDGGAVSAQVTVGVAPHTQGDLSGVMRGGAFVPDGTESHVFTGCTTEVNTQWRALHVEADSGTSGTITIEVRHAADQASLAAATFMTLGTFPTMPGPYPLTFPDGGVVEVRVTLHVAARLGAPRLGRVGLEWHCPGPM